MEQKIIAPEGNYRELDSWLAETGAKKILLVCDGSIRFQGKLNAHLAELKGRGLEIVPFSGFRPNPLYGSVVEGARLFREEGCNAIIAVGGGSAIDVAKCVKLYSNMSGDGRGGGYLTQPIAPNATPFLAMPTTAGTGSEATRYAVIYYEGKKQSVTHESCIPGAVLMDPDCLATLPPYQKKATMMDALCHAIESFWSVNSTEESKRYSRVATKIILANMNAYLAGDKEANAGMLKAANAAGKAINITQTTAGHAMCYKITSLFGVAHGHAAILCDRVLFPAMIRSVGKCVDPRGEAYLRNTLDEIAESMGCATPAEASAKLESIFEKLGLDIPAATAEQFEELRVSVNPVRLKNHPISLDEEAIDELYHEILR